MPAPPATPTAPTPPTLGERLRRRRWAELRVFQADLAAAAGLSPAQLCEIERGTAGTTEGTLARLAAALGLDFAELRAQAAREGRLAPRRGARGPAPDGGAAGPLAGPLPRVPKRRRRQPSGPWVSTAEAAALLGCTPGAVADLARRGRLRPAVLAPKAGRHQRRWLVAAEAVAGYEPPNAGRRWARRAEAAPPGHLSVAAFARRAGVPKATLYRRMARGEVQSVTVGRRRWIPRDQLAAARRGRGGA